MKHGACPAAVAVVCATAAAEYALLHSNHITAIYTHVSA
jgi:hypothetical protein